MKKTLFNFHAFDLNTDCIWPYYFITYKPKTSARFTNSFQNWNSAKIFIKQIQNNDIPNFKERPMQSVCKPCRPAFQPPSLSQAELQCSNEAWIYFESLSKAKLVTLALLSVFCGASRRWAWLLSCHWSIVVALYCRPGLSFHARGAGSGLKNRLLFGPF